MRALPRCHAADGKYEWTRISPILANGCKLLPRSGATLTVVGDRIYLFGGTEPVSGLCYNDLKALDPSTWTWSDVELVYGGAGYQGPMQDVWIYNTLQNGWSRPAIAGEQPAAREMHTGCMVDSTTMLVYGGRGAEFKVLCDAALFDAKLMRWTAIEPTPFSRCAHSSIVLPACEQPSDTATGGSVPNTSTQQPQQAGGTEGSSASGGGSRVLIYGGYSGEAVEGDVLQIDGQSLEIELVRRGPRESDKGGTVPAVRFAHSAAVVQAPGEPQGRAMVVFGGVNPKEDMNDVALWLPG
ncbi:hypothetical protein GPECTOR_2g1260 [Gonium pectorale]|uniref:Uncharacterized protein n=1 Tax=Gonium pectorale TaxID=33097 RepID=A0A150H2A4_GONPE|nr:hypothetical protein GPECTOR_2g1260 [Gonium pectorale]|eukprot:KXZ55710.1 hypothetical protein GPECTOR_2g1260 [Gonium pectorale]